MAQHRAVLTKNGNEEPMNIAPISWIDGQVTSWKPTTIRALGRDEGFLQNLVATSPNVLGLSTRETRIMGEWKTFREVILRAADGRDIRADVVALTGSGDVVVVEVKLADNRDLRGRDVIAQAIDYAAALADYEPDDLLKLFGGAHPDAQTWPELVAALFGRSPDTADLARTIADNVRQGEIHMVIACDGVPDGLVELVRAVSNQRALGKYVLHVVELRAYVSDDSREEILVMPMTGIRTEVVARTEVTVNFIGAPKDAGTSVTVAVTPLSETEDAIAVTNGSARRRWDEGSYLQAVRARCTPEVQLAIERLYAFAKPYGSLSFGTGMSGSFSAGFPLVARKKLITVYSDGILQIGLPDFPEALRSAMVSRVLAPAGAALPAGQSYPQFPPEKWVGRAAELEALLREFAGPSTTSSLSASPTV
jgi:hypothetical protein